ncbi:NDP-sugar epimerase, includes UDP-GlcNAc-inverting 4,6-dehydratase FlaA1 and capsular polysaccharide biosynthesis protein EpsC [Halopseudomonas litoralis]|uniref:NDP-sugar epimerase, includes UDP-GlcNAc-inverting 4,6-dehydratase FlaA1 and capsular polysaccharide biosynthesis protein EpsC n=1 Tax=Halopseudomonas litoralis TaxID=797277 RepID=A0A1H1S4R8_9GAMM|nr:NDP-sugar epimerase, includes UDP-GlcNAc-inverting 4,6-dehydratase FlaA1 and capsular polysaccharide biosynthesis protein EpsC [Halopseudomonas litoralis]
MLKERLIELNHNQKRSIQIVADVILLSLALWLALFLRLSDEGWLWPENGQGFLFLLAPLLAVPLYVRMGMYRAVMRHFGNVALYCIAKAVTLGFLAFAFILLVAKDLGWEVMFPRSVYFSYWALSLILIGGLRLLAREYFMGDWLTAGLPSLHAAREGEPGGQPVAIYGAGAAGTQLLASLKVGRLYKAVAFVDDDPRLVGRTIAGLRVYSGEEVGSMIAETGAAELLLALPSATRSRRQEILAMLQGHGVHVRTIPGIMDLASGKVKMDDLQEVDVADLLGRDPVPPDPSLFQRCIKDQAVMVTGAGGSIGSELCRQIVQSGPTTLVLFEHSEFALYQIHSELEGWIRSRKLEIQLVPIMGSIRNFGRLQDVIGAWDINTIYHAAAYKHVPMVEHNIAEGIMNNVFGTLNTAQAAIRCQVENFVLISTDKAVRPTNVMGSTKRLAELVLQALSTEQAPRLWGEESQVSQVNRTRFTMVRFGNVLGSSGSVIPRFREQIRRGGPVTVTHPDITRYFMTIPEAAQLVIQAGAMGQGGDVFVLDMGEPVTIVDLARKMIMLSGLTVRDEINTNGDIGITFSGLRPGEKLYEELLIGDNPEATAHSKIHRANEVHLPWAALLPVLDALRQAVRDDDYNQVRETLLSTVQGYAPSNGIVDLLYEQHHKLGS